MTIYEYRASLTVASGATSGTSLDVLGGLARQLIIRASSANTTFRANLTDYKGTVRAYWGFHTDELNETNMILPVAGKYTVNITNASQDGPFTVYLGVQE